MGGAGGESLQFFPEAPRLFHFCRWLRSNVSLHSPAVDQGFLQREEEEEVEEKKDTATKEK